MTPTPDTAITLHVGDRFLSNGGRGPLLAEVVGFEDVAGFAGHPCRLVVMEHWNPNLKRQKPRRRFLLAEAFLSSPSCGWKPLRTTR